MVTRPRQERGPRDERAAAIQLEEKAGGAEHGAHDERRDRAEAIGTRPEDANEEHRGDGRTDIRLHALQVDVHL